jgi:hypothetical protein
MAESFSAMVGSLSACVASSSQLLAPMLRAAVAQTTNAVPFSPFTVLTVWLAAEGSYSPKVWREVSSLLASRRFATRAAPAIARAKTGLHTEPLLIQDVIPLLVDPLPDFLYGCLYQPVV